MAETPHKVLAVDVYNDKIKNLLEPASLPWSDRIQFHRINIKNDSRLEGLIKMADLVKYCSENDKRIIHFSTCEVHRKQLDAFFLKITLYGW
ncbi:UDP-D-apiose/UDP-D-xylose synthase 2 [Camellia lanceoleosa]|uniref:UDP-D-apiose/UDP-D-xylose synthase 2 n=1 Tax=Camellia lanceoleosa TaxID=1840588 RepID=A0ACC0ING5_9ERIC|nr:UDP-D-apiose/UDP-D-xylose synthase 2 [Camellia lanceoleosa]